MITFLNRLNRWISIGMAWFILVPLAIITIEVVLRYGFGAPTIWAHASAIAAIAMVFMFGGIPAYQDGSHVSLTVYELFVPASLEPWRQLGVAIFIFVFLCVVSYAFNNQALQSIARWETTGSAWKAPVPVFIKCAMAAGAMAFAVEAGIACLRLAKSALRPDATDAR
jgi:TRAP-type C4-dicarboxylate transport system permease small subunit